MLSSPPMSPYFMRTTTTKDTGTVVFLWMFQDIHFNAKGQFVVLCFSAGQGQTQVLREVLEIVLLDSVSVN